MLNRSSGVAHPPLRGKGKPTSVQPRPWEGVPGFFTAPVRAWFGDDWQPLLRDERANNFSVLNMSAERERRAREGIGWGRGTLVMPNTPHHAMPSLQIHGRGVARNFAPPRGAVFREVAPIIRKLLGTADGLCSAALAEAAGLTVNEASTRIAQFRRMLRNAGKPDVHRTPHRGHAGVHYFNTAEQLAAWYGRQAW
jgi:hypothetical protein